MNRWSSHKNKWIGLDGVVSIWSRRSTPSTIIHMNNNNYSDGSSSSSSQEYIWNSIVWTLSSWFSFMLSQFILITVWWLQSKCISADLFNHWRIHHFQRVCSLFFLFVHFIYNSMAFKINYAHLFSKPKRSLINHFIIICCSTSYFYKVTETFEWHETMWELQSIV